VEQHVDLRHRGITFDHALHDTPHPTRTFAARGALAAAFMLVEFRQPRDRLYDIRRLVHDDDCSGAEPALDCDQAVEIHQHRLADGFRYDRHRRTAGNDAEQIVPAAANSAAVPLDQLAQRYAHRLFDIAGRVHVAGQAVDLGAGVSRPADAGKPGSAAPQDRRYDRNGLDIVD